MSSKIAEYKGPVYGSDSFDEADSDRPLLASFGSTTSLNELESNTPNASGSTSPRRGPPRTPGIFRRDPFLLAATLIAPTVMAALFIAFPFPTTVHAFIGLAAGLAFWVFASWGRLVVTFVLRTVRGATHDKSKSKSKSSRWLSTHLVVLASASIFTLFIFFCGIVAPGESIVPFDAAAEGKFFLAANLYNSEKILPRWSSEMIRLIEHLGPERCFVSIYESNSKDSTPKLLKDFETKLDEIGTPHRIIVSETERSSPYRKSPERIGLLAQARNRALLPLQSEDDEERLTDYDAYKKVVFFNDVVFSWQAIVRLLGTRLDDREGYDLACGMDYFAAGLYDTWVARDVCGTPLRAFWPFVKDPLSIERMRNDQPLEVSVCWNGVVAFPSGPYLYKPPPQEADISQEREIVKRRLKHDWKMVDNASDPNSFMSPAIEEPLRFRASNIDMCRHSECFLFSYDLHRLYNTTERPPRILMNPTVAVAYQKRWWTWHNVVLRVPIITWWLRYWARGFPYMFVDPIYEYFGRRRDFCTWSALANSLPERCPALPAQFKEPWGETSYGW